MIWFENFGVLCRYLTIFFHISQNFAVFRSISQNFVSFRFVSSIIISQLKSKDCLIKSLARNIRYRKQMRNSYLHSDGTNSHLQLALCESPT